MNHTTTIGRDRVRRANRATVAITAACALGLAAAMVPAIEQTITAVVLVLAVLAVVAIAARLVARWVRERGEDRADALVAAAWRAQHAPHLLSASRAAAGRPAPLAPARAVA